MGTVEAGGSIPAGICCKLVGLIPVDGGRFVESFDAAGGSLGNGCGNHMLWILQYCGARFPLVHEPTKTGRQWGFAVGLLVLAGTRFLDPFAIRRYFTIEFDPIIEI